MNNETVIVYWSPSMFIPEHESWTHLYSEPENFLTELNKKRNKEFVKKERRGIFSCPAYVDAMKNVFVVKSNFDINIEIPEGFLDREYLSYPAPIPTRPLSSSVAREPSMIGHSDLTINMGWLFFSEEPLLAKFTAPYFPTESPAPGVMLSPGVFNIGLWYRDYLLDYHVPKETKQLVFKEEQPMFYIEFMTDKKIIFKRYQMNSELRNLADECARFADRYKWNVPIVEKYNIGKRAKISNQILFHIKNNLIQ